MIKSTSVVEPTREPELIDMMALKIGEIGQIYKAHPLRNHIVLRTLRGAVSLFDPSKTWDANNVSPAVRHIPNATVTLTFGTGHLTTENGN